MQDEYEDEFGLSIGDVMSALLLVFIMLLLAMITSFNEKIESSNKFFDKQNELHQALKDKFQNKFDSGEWVGRIDVDGTMVFEEPEVLFNAGKYSLKEKFKVILNEFYPEYIEVLTDNNIKSYLKEIRIEGHTSSDHKSSDPYISNLVLSQNRSRSVLQYLLRERQILESVGEQDRDWFKSKVVALGFSSSRPVLDSNGEENYFKSKRVTFQALLDAESFLKKIK